MERLVRRLFFVTVAYTLGWHFSGFPLLIASIFVSALLTVLVIKQLIPDSRWPDLSELPLAQQSSIKWEVSRASFLYGIVYLFVLGSLSNYLKSLLGFA